MATHSAAMVGFLDGGAEVFDYGNSLRAEAELGGFDRAFAYPGFLPAYIRPLFCEGKGPFRWVALSGDPADIAATDRAVLEEFPDDDGLARWIRLAGERVAFQGLPARICWLGYGERHRLGLRFNEMVRRGELAAPIVIGRDHLDSGSVASPYRETEAMADGSDAIADWPLLNALVNTSSGATWVSIHHGGGVGIGRSIHAGMVALADGSDLAAAKLERVLTTDPGTGVMRHADAGYDRARRGRRRARRARPDDRVLMEVAPSVRRSFERDGAVCVRGAVDPDHVALAREAIDANLADLSPRAKRASAADDGAFVEDFCNWQRLPAMRRFIEESGVAAIAAGLMRSRTVRLYHDHVLVKEPGTRQRTPWHQDQPYYNIDGRQNASMWFPVDPVPRGVDVAVRRRLPPRRVVHAADVPRPRGQVVPRRLAPRAARTSTGGPDDFRILGWELEPGDAVFFHMLTLHAAGGVPGPHRRRGPVGALPRRRHHPRAATLDDLAAVPRPDRRAADRGADGPPPVPAARHRLSEATPRICPSEPARSGRFRRTDRSSGQRAVWY